MRLIDRRIGLLFATLLLLLLLALTRAAWIQGVQGAGLAADAQSQQTETTTIPGLRGRIVDRRGRELAVSEDAADVVATPYQVRGVGRTAAKLAPILHRSQTAVVRAIRSGSSGFAYVARQVPLTVAARIRKLGLAGISTQPSARRVYPEGDLASQVIGTVGTDQQGLTGLEAADNSMLAGSDGERQVVLDGLGKELVRHTLKAATDGQDVRLTLDAAIQARTEDVLRQLAATYRPHAATAIVMNPDDGQILAMADWPAANPSDPGAASPRELANTATGFTYEPGSTFKAFTVAGALSEHEVTPHTTFEVPPELQVADRTITDAEPHGPETLTVAQILAQSSNIGAIEIGMRLGKTLFDRWVRRFGFGKPTGIDFPGEERGIVPRPSQYSGSTIGNVPMGQGLSVTPIQIATAYAAIANGGILRPPRLVLSAAGQRLPEPPGHRVLTEANAAKLRRMLEGVLAPGGTASEVSVPGYVLAGKTGTAQKVVNGTYSDTEFVASFVGFAPASHPKLLAAIVVDDPTQGSYYGGTVAAPAFGQIAQFALPYLGIAPHSG
jgi:cell division protein FtsI (penicillin-binding protein 3)